MSFLILLDTFQLNRLKGILPNHAYFSYNVSEQTVTLYSSPTSQNLMPSPSECKETFNKKMKSD